MTGRCIFAYDLGTSSLKAIALDENGRILATATASYGISMPAAGWAEQNPDDWWDAFVKCTAALCAHTGTNRPAALSVCSQEMCCLPMSGKGAAVYPAIIWADTRAEEDAEQLKEKIGSGEYYRLTGMRPAANYPLAKMMWLRHKRPDLFAKTACFLNPKDYINFRLTGRMATDPECAAYMHCFSLPDGTWSDTLLQAAGIDKSYLPELLETGAVVGEVSYTAAKSCSLAAGTMVVMGIGDGGGATLGTGALLPGEAYTSLGTSGWVCMVSQHGAPDPLQRISKLRYLDMYRDTGTMQSAAYSLKWLVDTFCQAEQQRALAEGVSVHALLEDAASITPQDGVMFLPYLMGERAPYWDTRLTGAFLGLRAETTRAEMYHAVMEGVALHLRLIRDIILQTSGITATESMKLVGGGAESAMWRGIFAGIYGTPVMTVAHPNDACALGVGAIAGITAGLYPDLSVLREMQPVTNTTMPENTAYYQHRLTLFTQAHEAYEAVSHTL